MFYETFTVLDEVSPRYIRDPEDQKTMQGYADKLKKINKSHAPKSVKNFAKNTAEAKAREQLYKSLDKKRKDAKDTGYNRYDNYNKQVSDSFINHMRSQADKNTKMMRIRHGDKRTYDNDIKHLNKRQKAYYDKKYSKHPLSDSYLMDFDD